MQSLSLIISENFSNHRFYEIRNTYEKNQINEKKNNTSLEFSKNVLNLAPGNSDLKFCSESKNKNEEILSRRVFLILLIILNVY